MAQVFNTVSALILSARERSMKNANGDYVAKVIITLDKGRDVFAPLAVIQNTLDKMLVRSDLSMLEDSTLHYAVSTVKAGDEFAFTEGGAIEDTRAKNDMEITTIKAVVKTKRLRKHLTKCATYVQADRDPEHKEPEHKTSIDDLKAELAEITNVTNMRAFVQDNAIFDDHSDAFADFTTADQYREALTTILTELPF